MNTVLKVILIVVGLIFLLVVAAGVGGYFWWKHNKGTLMESVKAVSEEGSRFGAGTDNTGCLEEDKIECLEYSIRSSIILLF